MAKIKSEKYVEEREKYKYTVGNNLRYYMQLTGITQEKLAEICDTTRETISRVENGKNDTSITVIYLLARGLNISPDKLMEDVDRGELPDHLPRKKNEDYGRTVKSSRK